MSCKKRSIAAKSVKFQNRALFSVMIFMLICPFNLFSYSPVKKSNTKSPENDDQIEALTNQIEQNRQAVLSEFPDSIALSAPLSGNAAVVEDEIISQGNRAVIVPLDTLGVYYGRKELILDTDSVTRIEAPEWEPTKSTFNPDPTRAVWMSALFPGLGQIYNRRYWKLPIVVGAYLGLGYATNWNNSMLSDYTRAYSDIMDNDPSTKSYMDFFPSTTQESDLDKAWLTKLLKSRKDFYRRNRDLCIISMVGVYLLAMVDAYVDASLSHFDISPDLSMDVSPAVFNGNQNNKPSVGLQWAINF